MMLLITMSARGEECARALQDLTKEPVEHARSFVDATTRLRQKQYSAVIMDECLVDCDPESAEIAIEHIGAAIPIHLNLAISATDRVVREVQTVLRRNRRQRERAREIVQVELRHELNSKIAALLLSCELAQEAPGLPELASSKLKIVHEAARELQLKFSTTKHDDEECRGAMAVSSSGCH